VKESYLQDGTDQNRLSSVGIQQFQSSLGSTCGLLRFTSTVKTAIKQE